MFTYERWRESIGIPIHRGYYMEDLTTLELGLWKERQAQAAFIELVGQEGITETRVTEIPPRGSLPAVQLAFDEVVYVLKGWGATTVWRPGSSEKKSFEWHEASMFMLPRHYLHEIHNTHGSEPIRLLHYNYLPLAMSAVPDPTFFFADGADAEDRARDLDLKQFYGEATLRKEEHEGVLWGRRKEAWVGNFFPDMRVWDRLESNATRGAGGRSVFIEFPGSEMTCHMSVFAPRTYKKAHRHGPGRAIVIPTGEGYSVMWQEGKEKVVAPWRPGSMLTPPDRWFHQHFNVGSAPARYLALHPPMQFYGHAEKIEDRAKDQIEYVDEDPWIREKFEGELRARDLTSLVPAEAYEQRDYTWSTSAAASQAD
ncbi:MAG: cupin domain-containing protein [Chloroflexi bacterium]|nr:cupin domain-containing protein [Chloroflexota bacterium]